MALASSLQRPESTRYALKKSDDSGHYTLEVDEADVTCTCRGYEFRGQCKHARALKEGLAAGEVPSEFHLVSE